MKFKLTNTGNELLRKTLAGKTTITFTKLQFGNSTEWPENGEAEAEELKNPILYVPLSNAEIIDEYILLSTVFNNSDIEAGFHITELGVFVKDSDDAEYLYAIGLTKEENADYVPGCDERVLEFEYSGMVFISDSENVTAVLNDSLTNVTVKEFKKHIEDYNNPHRVTKNDVGLGNVQNLHINDQLPEFTETQTLENIISGKDKLSVLFGKIKKAISELIKHVQDTSNPHKITAEDIKAAAAKHEHSATDIKSGIMTVVRGGSGKGQFSKNSVLIGNDKEALGEAKGVGTLFSDGTNAPKFDTLPVQFGGTGLTEGAKFDGSDDYGCYGSVVLPGGLLVQWGRLRVAQGFGTEKTYFNCNFADTRYVVIFTTSSAQVGDFGGNSMPDWHVPDKSIDGFTMQKGLSESLSNHVADWVAFGKAPENN